MKLPDYERAGMYEAIFKYAKDGTETEDRDPLKELALRVIYDQIDDQRGFIETLPQQQR